jgi:hypothetical protein
MRPMSQAVGGVWLGGGEGEVRGEGECVLERVPDVGLDEAAMAGLSALTVKRQRARGAAGSGCSSRYCLLQTTVCVSTA